MRRGTLGVLIVLVAPAFLVVLTWFGGCACSGPTPMSEVLRGPEAVTELAATFDTGGLEARTFDDYSLVISRDGLNVIVFVEDDGESLQAVLPCTRLGQADPLRLERWNANHRFGRAYEDEDGRPALAMDLLVTEGLTRRDLVAWGRLTLDMAWAFVNAAWPDPSPSLTPTNE